LLDPINEESDIKTKKLVNGDIIVFQLTDVENRYSNVKDFYKNLVNLKDITFRNLDNPLEDVCTINLDTTISYKQISLELAKKLGLENADLLSFTRYNTFFEGPSSPCNFNEDLRSMINFNTIPILYFSIKK
jgi:hypothetical protein